MAQDQRNPQGPPPQQQQQKAQPGIVAPSSPFYSKDCTPPAPLSPSAAWLFERGWKCIGDPSWPNAQWFDPARPLKTEVYQEPCYGYVERLDHADRDAQGRPKLKLVREHLKDQDGSVRGNLTVPIMQTVVVPPASAMSMQEAILAQLDRERRQAEEAQKQQQKTA